VVIKLNPPALSHTTTNNYLEKRGGGLY